MIINFYNKDKSYENLCFVLLFFATVYFFSKIFFGIDFTDSFYHLNNALQKDGDAYAYPFFLSSYIIKAIVSFFGEKIILLRFFNAFLLWVSVFIPVVIIYKKIKAVDAILISISLFLFAPLNGNILGYDTFTIFITSVIFSIFLSNLGNFRIVKFLILIWICCIAILIRLPNLIIPLLISGWIVYYSSSKGFQKTKKVIPFLLFTTLGSLIAYLINYGSWSKMMDSWKTEYYGPLLLIKNYFLDGLYITMYLLFSFLIYKSISANRLNTKVRLLLVGTVHFLILIIHVAFSKYSHNYALYLVSIFILYVLIQGKQEKSINFPLILLSTLLIFPFGSNTGLIKASFVVIFFPIIFRHYRLQVDKIRLYYIFFPLIFVSVLENAKEIFEDQNIFRLTGTLEEKLYPIRTNPQRKKFLEEIESIVAEFKKEDTDIFFYGNKSHVFHFLYPGTDLTSGSFFQPIDDFMINPQVQRKIKNKENFVVFIVNQYPEGSNSKIFSFEQQLGKMGFERFSSGSVVYYKH